MITTTNSKKQLANLVKHLYDRSGCKSVSEYGRKIGFSHASLLDWMGEKGKLSARGYEAVASEANCSIDQLKHYLESALTVEEFLADLSDSPVPAPLVFRSIPEYDSPTLGEIIEECTRLLIARSIGTTYSELKKNTSKISTSNGFQVASLSGIEESDLPLFTSLKGSTHQAMQFNSNYLVLGKKKARLASWVRESMIAQGKNTLEFAEQCAPGDREFLALLSYLIDERTDEVHLSALNLLAPNLRDLIRWEKSLAIIGINSFSGQGEEIASVLDKNGLRV